MNDFIKISGIYAILLMLISIFDRYFSTDNLLYLKTFLVQIVVMIILFKLFNVKSKSIMIFLGVMTFLMTLVALDSNVLFGKYADLGLYMEDYIIPLEIAAVSAVISKPFMVLFIVLEDFGVVQESMYIIPVSMLLITYVSVKLCKLSLVKKN